MDKLLIIDGHNLLFQMFYGMPSRITNQNGKAIHGTLGFIGAVLKIIRAEQPTHIVAIFDGEHENSRVQLNMEYKANRPDYGQMRCEDTPFSQLADVYAALDYLGIAHMETTDCETDDVVASYARTFGRVIRIVIVSFDSDFFQLITESVTVLRYRGDRTVVCDPIYMREKFGIRPEQYVDFKALTGDVSDNIKGVPKVGPKTAAQLLSEFASLETIIDNVEYILKPSIRDAIRQNEALLRTNHALIHLDGKAGIPFRLENLTYSDNGIKTNDVLYGIGLR